MTDNKDKLVEQLRALQLSRDEAVLYLQLLKSSGSHLQLARATGINRTKVYRLAEQLQKRSLVTVQTDDTGTFLAASDPAALEVELSVQEETLHAKRSMMVKLLPSLASIKQQQLDPLNFIVRTYEGEEGFKQMLWHELKARPELVSFGPGTIEDLVPHPQWTEKLRQRTVEAGYTIRELMNPKARDTFTRNEEYMRRYILRYISPEILPIRHQTCIYNHTVATYCWRDGQKVGFEVINKAYADTMRGMFEVFWGMSEATEADAR